MDQSRIRLATREHRPTLHERVFLELVNSLPAEEPGILDHCSRDRAPRLDASITGKAGLQTQRHSPSRNDTGELPEGFVVQGHRGSAGEAEIDMVSQGVHLAADKHEDFVRKSEQPSRSHVVREY